jgi:hypothetical protein
MSVDKVVGYEMEYPCSVPAKARNFLELTKPLSSEHRSYFPGDKLLEAFRLQM